MPLVALGRLARRPSLGRPHSADEGFKARALASIRSEDFVVLVASAVLLLVCSIADPILLPTREQDLPFQILDLGVTKSDGSPATVVLRDPSYDKPILDEKVPNSMLGIINVAGVVLTGFVGGFLPQYAFGGRGEGMRALSAAFVSVGVCTLAAGILRSYFGSLRPNFFAGCGWNNTLGACTTGWKGEHDDLDEGRRSFPSGHTASAYSTLFLLSLCLLRVARATRASIRASRAAEDHVSWRKRLLPALLTVLAVLPTTGATLIAATRVTDYYHFTADVVAGALLGVASAALAAESLLPHFGLEG
mmetsp:Transcript_9999/g.30502  ORF Transcript_9999/g.30502 Transcript_9999/m.30502 type:complete len:305 (-) Transcript_9999:33-947(-)